MSATVKEKKRRGLILIFTGDGKGKTTGALGLGMRAVGHGMKVLMVQFIKAGWKYGELESAKRLDNFEIHPLGMGYVLGSNSGEKGDDFEVHAEAARKALDFARERTSSGGVDLLILDEINYAIDYALIKVSDVIDFIRNSPPDMHIVLTGRNARPELIELADLVTEMKEIKHHFRRGIRAVKGVEF